MKKTLAALVALILSDGVNQKIRAETSFLYL
jgi:hypothetical protein